uniref:Uncharacterized protein n=1 Tax=Timema douglasi TaxID=61478 RepID=A0A7R8VRN5_TIMDO|nr:unnamed protein product [Timema douglasi]
MSQDLPEYPEYFSRPTRVTRVCLKTSPSNQNGKSGVIQNRYRNHTPNENLIRSFVSAYEYIIWSGNFSKPSASTKEAMGLLYFLRKIFPLKHSNSICSPTRASYTYQAQRSNNETHNSNNRLSWPIFPSHNEENTSSRQQRTSEQPISEDNEIKMVERARRDSQKSQAGALERVLCPNDARVMERANQIVITCPGLRPPSVAQRRPRGGNRLPTVAYDQSIFTLLVSKLVTIIYDPDLSFGNAFLGQTK